MASWMVHLRVADKILSNIKNLQETDFVMGNIAPDSGVPNEDWSKYTPNKIVSHFKDIDDNGESSINDGTFIEKYFTSEMRRRYNSKQFSFHLGYLVHLWTDQLWHKNVYEASKTKFSKLYGGDEKDFIWLLKDDWYDLDMLFIENNPDFKAFFIYEKAIDFKNTYMEEFAEDAFKNRQKYIVSFYRKGKEGIQRKYKYMTEEDMSRFVDDTADIIIEKIESLKKEQQNI